MMFNRRRLTFLLILLVDAGIVAAGDRQERVDYVQDVKPILSRRCYSCHGALKQKNDLRVDTAALAIKGGSSGAAIVPGKSDESLLLDAVTGADGVKKMPPEGEPLTAEQIAVLRAWIDQGAKAPVEKIPQDPARHWSYQSPVRPPLPASRDPAWIRNSIDAFVSAEHDRHGLKPSPAAAKRVLLRRVYLDLIGLPPTRSQMQAFLADDSTDAYERVVDGLLDSPHYGERWGRHWMDVWRYSDWDGFGAEVRESQPHIWRWRDWIIEGLNADKPYDRMIVEMLAGDEAAPDDPSAVRATGFLVRNWYKFNRNVWLDFSIEHTAKAFLGTTLNCARCHDHMYDPISQQDYYRFRAFFEAHDIRTDHVPGQPDTAKDGLARVYDANAAAPTFLFTRGDEKNPDKDHPLAAALPEVFARSELKVDAVTLSPAAYYPGSRIYVQDEALAQAKADVEKSQAGLKDTGAKLAVAKQKLAEFAMLEKVGDAPAPVSEADLVVALKQAEAARALAEKTVATAGAAIVWTQARIAADRANYATSPPANAKELSLIAGAAERQHALSLAEQNLLAAEQKLAAARALPNPADDKTKKAITDGDAAVAAAVKARDGALEVIGQPNENYTRFGPVYPATSSGRRLALARWIADRSNPLTARVAINHIWMRHFGSPLVPSVFDFGLNGKAPTHPALLDWLAVELMDGDQSQISEIRNPKSEIVRGLTPPARRGAAGWRMKHIHRLIVTSNAYRQQSSTAGADESNRAIDPDNLFLWRMNVRRMEAEIIRDSTLHVAGRLDETMAGPELDENSGMTASRRSVYFRNSKEKKMTFLDLFDRPNVVECYRRSESVVPQQALAMANSPLSLAQARLLAKTLSAEAGPETNDQTRDRFVSIAFEQVLSRPPSAAERAECDQFLAAQAQRFADPKLLTQFATGTPSHVPAATDPQQRARENLVHVLLNHNDFLTIR